MKFNARASTKILPSLRKKDLIPWALQWFAVLTVCFIIFSAGAAADEIAYTESGRTVLLKADGTWAYLTEGSKDAPEYHFRKIRWGMTRQRVKAAEKAKFLKENADSLTYQGTANGINCEIYYIFVDDQLAKAGYSFINEYLDPKDYIRDFKNIKELLTKKYKKPIVDKTLWKDDQHKENPSNYGAALRLGHLSYAVAWAAKDTEIQMELSGGMFDTDHFLFYQSKLFKKKLNQPKKEDKLEDF